MRCKSWVMWVLLLTCLVRTAVAAVPRTINFQGRLTDAGGNPVSDSLYNVSIRLYDSANAPVGDHVWADTFDVQTKNGYFEVALGSQVAFPSAGPGAMDFNQQYFVGIKVGADNEMTPRQALQSVPYSIRSGESNESANAQDADALDGLDSTAFIRKNLANVESADIAASAVDAQNKAPWAPVVWRYPSTTGSYPKIVYGETTTNAAGEIILDISSYGFAETPIFVASFKEGVGYLSARAINTSTVLGNTWDTGLQPMSITINWILIGR